MRIIPKIFASMYAAQTKLRLRHGQSVTHVELESSTQTQAVRACVWVFVCVGCCRLAECVCVTVFICMMLCVGASARRDVAENTIINNVFRGWVAWSGVLRACCVGSERRRLVRVRRLTAAL